jgi:uncharacterized protein (TIGR02231 family)
VTATDIAGTDLFDAPIVAVTVFTDRARVTRRGTLRLPPGAHTVPIGPLPLGTHRDSVRVGGRGPGTVLGVDMVTRHQARTADTLVAELEARRRALTAELTELADVDAVAAQRADFLVQLAQRAGGSYARTLAAGDTDPATVIGFADSIDEQLTAGRARRRELAARTELVNDEIAALDRRLAEISGKRVTDQLVAAVALTVDGGDGADSAEAEVTLELSYLVDEAGWQSSYDLRLVDDRLTLTWFGLIIQRTGEDWPECELQLSTARPSGAVTVPELDPWYLYRIQPVPRAFAAPRRAGGGPCPSPRRRPPRCHPAR